MLGIFDLSSEYNIDAGRVEVTAKFYADTWCLFPYFPPSSTRCSVVTLAVFWAKKKIRSIFIEQNERRFLVAAFIRGRFRGERLVRRSLAKICKCFYAVGLKVVLFDIPQTCNLQEEEIYRQNWCVQ